MKKILLPWINTKILKGDYMSQSIPTLERYPEYIDYTALSFNVSLVEKNIDKIDNSYWKN